MIGNEMYNRRSSRLTAKEAARLASDSSVIREDIVHEVLKAWLRAIARESAAGNWGIFADDVEQIKTPVSSAEMRMVYADLDWLGYRWENSRMLSWKHEMPTQSMPTDGTP